MSLTADPPRFTHHDSTFTPSASASASAQQPKPTLTPATHNPAAAPAPAPTSASAQSSSQQPLSSPASSSSTSSSVGAGGLADSEILGGGQEARLNRAGGSTGSLATTASTGSIAGSSATSQSRDNSISRGKMAVVGEHSSTGSGPGSSQAQAGPTHTGGPPKLRRSSTTSSEASGQYYDAQAATPGSSSGAGGAGEVGRPRRKSARMGSFEPRSTSQPTAEGYTNHNQDQDGDDEADPPSWTSAQTSPAQTAPREPPSSAAAPTAQPAPAPRSVNHVDIVSYPSADLLRLLASLLEQIAKANDALHQRAASASGSRPRSGVVTPGGTEDPHNAFERGRFDAAPLNSPITPLARPHMGDILMRDRNEGEGEDEDEDQEEELPVTPGVDLLREVGSAGGVDGFMPSLGGTHYPVPLARRRGSSFLRARDINAPAPAYNRTRSAGPTNTGPSMSAAGPLPGSIPPGSTPPVREHAFPANAGGGNGSSSKASGGAEEQPLTCLLTASSVALSSPSATLCFHARNVPAISIEAYLLRILKYCPTTNEVFLSLLVYFDRMARVGLEAQRLGLVQAAPRGRAETSGGALTDSAAAPGGSRLFAIDSFNIHRLIIAGVTVASKFFSDVFYTNSRYAKVGGLPLNELNQLELQFLLLNDFRLKIPVDELQRYADQLILYWVGRNGEGPQVDHPGEPGAAPVSSGQAPAQAPAPARQPSATPAAGEPLTASAVASAALLHQQQHQQHQPQHQPHHSGTSTPRRPSPGQHVGSAFMGRPRSVRSQPSSSGTSVTSTVTPGTPSTPRNASGGWPDDTPSGSEAGEPMDQD